MRTYTRSFLFFAALVLLAGAGFRAQAQMTPVVSSFTASPQSLSSGYSTILAWQTVGGYGVNIYFSCPSGVTLQDANGYSVNCSAAQSLGAYSSGSAVYTPFNVSGTVQTVRARLVPKDLYGNEVVGSAMTIGLTVSNAPQTITNFAVSSSDIQSGGRLKLTWTGVYVGGVNLQFDCNSNLQFVNADNASSTLICGAPAYSPDLSASGSANLGIINTSFYPVTERIVMLPAMGGGLYDATHAQSVSVVVEGRTVAVTPSIVSFSSSNSIVYNGQPFSFSWQTANAAGVNLQFQCDNSLTFSASTGTTTVTLPCATPAFSPALPPSGNTTIYIANKGNMPGYTTAYLLLQNSDGTYTTMGSKTVAIQVLTTPPPTASAAPAAGTYAVTVNNSGGSAAVFTLSLGRGSRGAQVTNLQTYLAKDSSLYPEGLVTGYFGAATETAVGRFQVRYGIANPGDSGYGYVGPKTRLKLNLYATAGTSGTGSGSTSAPAGAANTGSAPANTGGSGTNTGSTGVSGGFGI